jgi:hypothetical protein
MIVRVSQCFVSTMPTSSRQLKAIKNPPGGPGRTGTEDLVTACRQNHFREVLEKRKIKIFVEKGLGASSKARSQQTPDANTGSEMRRVVIAETGNTGGRIKSEGKKWHSRNAERHGIRISMWTVSDSGTLLPRATGGKPKRKGRR